MSQTTSSRKGLLWEAFSRFPIFPVAYGCWRLNGSEGEAPPASGDRSGIAAVHAADDAGFNFFDLADIYGRGESERIFGLALRQRPGMRDRVVILSKCGIRPLGSPNPLSPYRYDFSREHIVRSVEGSLRRMGVDTLDVLLLHRPDYLMDPAEVGAAFDQLREQGKVREFGVSNFRPVQADLLQKHCPMKLVTHQVQLSLFHSGVLEDGTMDHCQLKEMTPMAWSPLARGKIGTFSDHGLSEPDFARLSGLKTALQALGNELGVTPTLLALAWLLRHPANVLPIIGTTNPARIAELAGALRVTLSREMWYKLLEAGRGTRLP